MKKTIITILFAAISLIGISQPKKLNPEVTFGTVSIKFNYSNDTLHGNFIIYDKEGYLQKKHGTVFRKIKNYESGLSPVVESETYILDNGTQIKLQDIFDFKPN